MRGRRPPLSPATSSSVATTHGVILSSTAPPMSIHAHATTPRGSAAGPASLRYPCRAPPLPCGLQPEPEKFLHRSPLHDTTHCSAFASSAAWPTTGRRLIECRTGTCSHGPPCTGLYGGGVGPGAIMSSRVRCIVSCVKPATAFWVTHVCLGSSKPSRCNTLHLTQTDIPTLI